jgi:hypothetical protein
MLPAVIKQTNIPKKDVVIVILLHRLATRGIGVLEQPPSSRTPSEIKCRSSCDKPVANHHQTIPAKDFRTRTAKACIKT